MTPFSRGHWLLPANAAFLNHGSFGACPREVLGEQEKIREEMERAPDVFFRRQIMPRAALSPQGEGALRKAAAELATYIDAKPGNVAFVENASVGVACALRSVALAAGDEILITNHTYNAVRLMVEARCAETGARVRLVEIPVPTTADAIVAGITQALSPSVKLAILDHITSPTALVIPLERILPALRANGTRVIVDGAHALGQIPLSMAALQPDWYVSNAHKWLFAPKGTAILYAADDVAPLTQPPLVSHYVAMGFPASFDWIGTRDYSPWLSVPAALRFWNKIDPPLVREHQALLLRRATELLAPLGIEPVAPLELCAAMRSFVLPQQRAATPDDAVAVMSGLWDKDRVQVMAVAWGERLLLRVSAHAYVAEEDLQSLRRALEAQGWPGRGAAG